ncbi:MAG: DNA helicase RecQ [Oscillospiraceae bacterium]
MDKFEVLKQYFGHDEFRSGQSEIIDNILAGRDVLGIMPTGAGKSVCYQVPAMLLDGITIVISPLISLMKDQVESLVQSGIPAAYINSSLSFSQYQEVLRRASAGEYKLIYVAPERLVTDGFLSFSEQSRISMVTVDESHCVSQWGQDFRPSYLKIPEYISKLSYRPVVSAFTATATEHVKEDISSLLGLRSPFTITTGFDRQNLYFEVRRPAERLNELLRIVDENRGKSTIVYCATRKNVEVVCDALCDKGFSATRYHAGLSDDERRRNQDAFLYDRCGIMVATNAFGMGIDKSNVSLIIHYNMPKNIESYYQEAGRAGRDGEPASCILLYNGQDVALARFLIENSNEDNEELTEREKEELRRKDYERLKQMTFYATTNDCLRASILKYFGEKPSSFCGHCSNCCTSFETADITTEAQKIISCVYRIYNHNGRYLGKAAITDILHGSKAEKLIKNGYDTLSTYGIMADMPIHRIRLILDELIEKGFLGVREGEYPVVVPTELTANAIRSGQRFEMKLPKEVKRITAKQKPAEHSVNTELLSKLKEKRREIAEKAKIPAYLVFTDATLRDMCRRLPETIEEFLGVSGVGRKKSESYGEEFLKVIKENADAVRKSGGKNGWSIEETERLRDEVESGLSLSQISARHGRTPDEIRTRLHETGILR